ncbi:MAG: zinc-ribbon domain-containing protein [Uliginosibacterium sp.]|nr:zinc-ribbon domain-containing protein [Uliginosibacterium sp.]
MPCPRCGYENPSNARFCARCNAMLQAEANPYNPDDQMKVVLPPVIRPLQPVFRARPVAAPANQPAANSAPLNPSGADLPESARDAGQTVVLDPKAVAAITQGQQAKRDKQTPKQSPELAKQATHFSIAIGTASVVLLAMAVAYYLFLLRKEKPVEAPLPPVAISAPVVAALSAPAPEPVAESAPAAVPASEPLGAVPQQSQPAATAEPPPVLASAPAVAPAIEAAADPAASTPQTPSGPRVLAPREVVALLRVLKTRSSTPLDCSSATAMLVKDHDVAPRQANRIAKLAYPELCLPARPAAAPATPRVLPAPERAGNTASPATTPAQTRPKARTIDELYEERIGSECSRGAFGHICRESVRLTLCSGKLSDNPPPGQSVCTQ